MFILPTSMAEYVGLVSIISNLSIDPCMALYQYNSSADINLAVDVAVVFNKLYELPRLVPVLSVSKGARLHFKHQLLRYLGSKTLSLGNFLSGRRVGTKGVNTRTLAELSEEMSLLPHLDLRHRRFAYVLGTSDVRLRHGFWYLPIALIAGVHRWGISWKRIIASTYAMHLHFMLSNLSINSDLTELINDYEVELITISFVEAAYTSQLYRLIMREAGERFYSVFREPLKGIDEWAVNVINELMSTNQIINRVRKLWLKHLPEATARFISRVKQGINVLIRALDNGKYGVSAPPFTTVYLRNIESFNKLVDNSSASEESIYLLFATETWSPYNIYALARLSAEKLKATNINIAILYTPQTLPQVIFSLLTFPLNTNVTGNGDNRKAISRCQLINNPDNKMHELCNINEECIEIEPFRSISINTIFSDEGKNFMECNLRLYLVPLIGKSPSIVHSEIKALIKYLALSKKFDSVITHSSLTGIASIEASLIKLENEKPNGIDIKLL